MSHKEAKALRQSAVIQPRALKDIPPRASIHPALINSSNGRNQAVAAAVHRAIKKTR